MNSLASKSAKEPPLLSHSVSGLMQLGLSGMASSSLPSISDASRSQSLETLLRVSRTRPVAPATLLDEKDAIGCGLGQADPPQLLTPLKMPIPSAVLSPTPRPIVVFDLGLARGGLLSSADGSVLRASSDPNEAWLCSRVRIPVGPDIGPGGCPCEIVAPIPPYL